MTTCHIKAVGIRTKATRVKIQPGKKCAQIQAWHPKIRHSQCLSRLHWTDVQHFDIRIGLCDCGWQEQSREGRQRAPEYKLRVCRTHRCKRSRAHCSLTHTHTSRTCAPRAHNHLLYLILIVILQHEMLNNDHLISSVFGLAHVQAALLKCMRSYAVHLSVPVVWVCTWIGRLFYSSYAHTHTHFTNNRHTGKYVMLLQYAL